MLQEDIENRSVALSIKAAKLTGKGLAVAMRAALSKMHRPKGAPAPGRTSIKKLARQGELQSIEVTHDNIKSFEPVARKFGVHYALQKDVSQDPPKWIVLFKAKDVDALTAAFKEFSAKTLNRKIEKPSVRETMRNLREVVKNAVVDRTKHKERSGPER